MAPTPEQERVRVLLPRQQSYMSEVATSYETASEPVQLPVSHYLWIIRQQRWRIAAFVAASVLVTYILCSRIRPQYEATTTIEVDRQTPSGPFDHGFFFDSGMGLHGGDSPYQH